MDEGFDESITPVSESMDFDIEPVVEIPVEEPAFVESMDEFEPPISENEMTELENAAEELVEPLDDGIDLGYDHDEAIAEANDYWAEMDALQDISAAERIAQAATSNVDCPGVSAQVTGGFADGLFGSPQAETAQLTQMVIDGAPVAAQELMTSAYENIATPAQRAYDASQSLPRNVETGEIMQFEPAIDATATMPFKQEMKGDTIKQNDE